MRNLPISMTESLPFQLSVAFVCTTMNTAATMNMAATIRRTIKTDIRWKPRGRICHIHSIDNNKTTVCHLALLREFSCLFWRFLTHGEEIECEVTGRSPYSWHKELVARAKDIITGENKTK